MTWWQASAFLLAKRPLSEYKEIWEFFSDKYGRLSLVVPLSRRYRHLDYGQQLDVAWRAGAALPTVRTLELRQCLGVFSADTGIFILYLNELLRNLLPEHEPHPVLFQHYASALKTLIQPEKSDSNVEFTLRRFELLLLSDLGFALPVEKTQNGQMINYEKTYAWHIPEGASAEVAGSETTGSETASGGKNGRPAGDLELSGQVLQFLAAWRDTSRPALALSAAQWQSLSTLLRATLAYYLAGKSLQTRKLWQMLHS